MNIENSNGYIRPAINYATTNIKDSVKLRIDANSKSTEIISIVELFNRTVKKYPDCPALVYTNFDGVKITINYREYQQKVLNTAKVLIKLGLQSQETIAILAHNCPEWFYTELGCIHAGGVCTGIYLRSSTETIINILNTSKSSILVLDNKEEMLKILQIKDPLPYLKIIIQINGPLAYYSNDQYSCYSWKDIEGINTDDVRDELYIRLKNLAVNECCLLLYTSNTSEMPKAVMLSHDNITSSCKQIIEALANLESGKESIVSYLPMNHIIAQFFDIFMAIKIAAVVHFADKNALRGSLIKTLSDVQPTYFFAVPRVWEKFQEYLIKLEANSSFVYKVVSNRAKNVALNYHLSAIESRAHSDNQMYKVARSFLNRTVKSYLGLNKLKYAIVGGTSTTENLIKSYLNIDIELLNSYGLTETSCFCFISESPIPNFKQSGTLLKGYEAKIINSDESGNGELCVKGRSIFMGYMNDLEKTKEIIDENGWLHTGDLGQLHPNNLLTIKGRITEIYITSEGESIPSKKVEEFIKTELPGLSNVVVFGDKRKYLSALLTFKTDSDEITGLPGNSLQLEALELMKSLDLPYKTLNQILNAGPCPKVLEAIQNGINRANDYAISDAQKVQKFAILPQDFSEATGELGPTLKLKRDFIAEKYNEIIEKLYT